MGAMLVVWAFVLGLAVGSFLNVVIYRLPRGQSVVFPPSHCPACGKRLTPAELVPVLSYLWQKGRCRRCGARISPRYPLVEALSGLLFAFAAWWVPWPQAAFSWFFFAALVALAFIDAEHEILPDALTYGGLGLGLVFASFSGLASLARALDGAALASGLLVLIGGYGALWLRRGRDARGSWPVGFHQVYLAALVGALLGPGWGLLAGVANWVLNWVTRRRFELPEPLSLLGLVLVWAAAWMGAGAPFFDSVKGALFAAGGVALLGGLYWALVPATEDDDGDEAVALGFGDVKLAGMLGAWVGFGPFLVGLFFAVVAGALTGAVLGQRRIPFGPFLALGGVLAFFFGQAILNAYLAFIGW